MLIQLDSSETRTSFTLFFFCPSSLIITKVRKAQGSYAERIALQLQHRSIWINSGFILSAANLAQANGAR